MQRIGVFVCHCGTNIAGTVDVKAVAEALGHEPSVVYSVDYHFVKLWYCKLYVVDDYKSKYTEKQRGGVLQIVSVYVLSEYQFEHLLSF